MKAFRSQWIAHTVALAAGACVALAMSATWSGQSWPHDAASPDGQASGGAASQVDVARRRAQRAPQPSVSKAERYRLAWAQLEGRPMPASERHALRQAMLAEWAEADLDGALAAAAQANRLRPDGMISQSGGLFEVFRPLMMKSPELFLTAIQDGRFGLATGELRNEWLQVVGQHDPAFLAGHWKEFSGEAQMKCISKVLLGLKARGMTEQYQGILRELVSLPDSAENRSLWQTVGRTLIGENPGDLAAQLADSASEGERRMLLAGLANNLTNLKDAAAIRSSFEQVPESMKKETALAILGGGMRNESALVAADYLLEKNEWELVQKKVAVTIHELGGNPSSTSGLLAWGMNLPERSETEDLYRCTVRGFIYQQPEQAKNWIMAMPPGWKRDNALTEYVHSMVILNRDEQADWALERIESSHFRQVVDTSRGNWKAHSRK